MKEQQKEQINSPTLRQEPPPSLPPQDPPQSMLDTISGQAVVEQEQETVQKKKRFSLPRITPEMFFEHSRLKRKVKFVIVGYIVLVVVPLIYGFYTQWQKNNDLEAQRELREQQFIFPLTTLDNAEYIATRQLLYTTMQVERDPVYALYALEQLASRAEVRLINPTYNIDTSKTDKPVGVHVTTIVRGTHNALLTYLKELEQFRYVITIDQFVVRVTDTGESEADLVLEYVFAPKITEEQAEMSQKLAQGLRVDYPIAGADTLIEQLQSFTEIIMDKLGTYVVGKGDLFAS